MKKIAVVGYGVIGKRVADAINAQDDMKLAGVCDAISDWRIQNAVKKGYAIYAVIPETIDAIRALTGIETDVKKSIAKTNKSLGID